MTVYPHPLHAQGGFVVNNAGDATDPDAGTVDDDMACDTALRDNQGNPINNNICTLRAAIENANARGGGNITFAGGMTIFPGSVLPRILVPVSIDGGGQVTLDAGNGVGGGDQIFDPAGLKIVAPGSTVRGMNFVRWHTGILLSGGTFNGVTMNADNTLITDNSFGGDPNTTPAPGNSYGIFVQTSHNIIQGNSFTGNRTGIYVIYGGHNTIQSNTITYNGVNGGVFGGNQFIIYGQDGLLIVDSTYNTVVDNVIGGNGRAGIWLIGYNNPTHHHIIRSNFIGVSEAGAAAIPNGQYGIFIGADDNTIGGPNAGDGNIISGNNGPGLYVGNNRNFIQNNRIGVDLSGMVAIPNQGDGLSVQPSSGGNSHTILQNQISGNTDDGIEIAPGNEPTTIYGNLIGLNADGTAAIPNGGHGINVGFTGKVIIGGLATNQGNVISGNGGHGIVTSGIDREIVGNRIGVNAAATAKLGNGGDGIRLNDAGRALIRGNIIGGNGGDGIYNFGYNNGGNQIQGNWIGTNSDRSANLGNTSDGFHGDGGAPIIGGTSAAEGNVIANNGGHGILIERYDSNQARGNAAYNNGGLGVDLGGNGVDINDLFDHDINLANSGQNYPVLVSASSGQATIAGTFFGAANQTFHLDFFSSNQCDPSGNGEGEFFLGTTTVSTDNSGYVNFTFASGVNVPDGAFVTATATNAGNKNVSEFSRCLAVPTVGNVVRWNNPNGGNWSNPTNWTPAVVPQAPHNVIIDLPGDYTVNLDIDAPINSLQLGNSSGTQLLDIPAGYASSRFLSLAANSLISGGGRVRLDGGNLISNGELHIGSTLEWLGGRLAGSGSLVIDAGGRLDLPNNTFRTLDGVTLTNDGQITIGTGAVNSTLFTTDNGPTITNRSNLELNGSIRQNPYGSANPGRLVNSGTLRLTQPNLSLAWDPVIENSGLIEVALNSAVVFSNGYTQSAGELRLNVGTVYRNSYGTEDLIINGGLVTGNGNLFANLVNNGGTVSPGQSPGRLVLRGLVQGAGGTLNIELAGRDTGSFSTQFDLLDSSFSNVTLGGTLNISTIDSFSSVEGDTFHIITANNVSGQFATVNGPNLGNGATYQVNYAATNVTLSHGQPAPEMMDLAISLSSSSVEVNPNTALSYYVNVSNYQPGGGGGAFASAARTADATAANSDITSSQNVVVTLNLPAGVTFQAATTTQGECTGPAVGATGTVTCALGEVFQSFEGPSVYITIDTLVTAASGQLVANANINSDTPDSDTSNNQATATVTVIPVVTDPQLTIVLDSQPDNARNVRFDSPAPIRRFYLDDITPQDSDAYGYSRTFTLTPGSYSITQLVPATTWFLSDIVCTGGNPVINLATGRLTVTLNRGDNVVCTFVDQQAGVVRATLFHDRNGNGTRQSTEPWNVGWTVTLFTSQNTQVASGVTNNQGKVSFTNVRPGNYTLCETLRDGLTHPQPCQPITVAPAQTVQVTFANRTPTITGAAVDEAATTVSTFVNEAETVNEDEEPAAPTDEAWLNSEEPAVDKERAVRQQAFLPLVTK